MQISRRSIIRINKCLTDNLDDKEIASTLDKLTKHVPYRFLSPWINTADNKEMVERSHTLENGCLYSIHKTKDDFHIAINPAWDRYLTDYYGILTDFVNWNLTLFLQSRNPNIPNIPNKLTRPVERAALTRQHRFWNDVIKIGGNVHCISKIAQLGRDKSMIPYLCVLLPQTVRILQFLQLTVFWRWILSFPRAVSS